jgi:glycosyltransferase involved in cell wall biosynthesis
MLARGEFAFQTVRSCSFFQKHTVTHRLLVMGTLDISVVIPCYMTGNRVYKLIAELNSVLNLLSNNSFEIIMVVDGSPDDTWVQVKDAAQRLSHVHGINFMKNYGQHSALLAGVRIAKGEIIVTIDDDFQHSPSDIPKLISALNEDIDIAYAVSVHDEHSFIRNLGSRLYKKFAGALLRIEGAEIAGAFRAFKKDLLSGLAGIDDLYAPLDVVLAWSSRKSVAVPVEMHQREDGSSNYSARRLFRHAVNAVTGYSIAPLRLVSMIGLFAFAVSFIIAIVVLVNHLLGRIEVAGFPTLAILVSMFAGVQLLSLGILGEYLGRLHMRSMGRPRYVIREEI